MNERNLKLLNDFANSHSLATHIKVEISDHVKSFKPRTEKSYAKYEEANMLANIICGAENFLYFLERGNYEIRRKKKVG